MHLVIKPGYRLSRRWTPLEVAVWFSTAVVTIAVVVLVVTKVVGPWALVIQCLIVAAVGLMRYRAEAGQKKRVADEQSE
jgi:chromate transport protein ChrA